MIRQRQIALAMAMLAMTAYAGAASGEGNSAAGRDKDNAITAQDQSTKPADVQLTQKIRQELMKRDFSEAARNLTVVTVDGTVTLKGAVATEAEKARVRALAGSYAAKVNNEIVVSK